MPQPLNVVAIMKAKPGEEAALGELLQSALVHFQQEPGCRAYALLTDLENPARFVSYESWDDEAALQAHMKAPTLANAMPVLEKILAEPIQQIRLNQLPGSTV